MKLMQRSTCKTQHNIAQIRTDLLNKIGCKGNAETRVLRSIFIAFIWSLFMSQICTQSESEICLRTVLGVFLSHQYTKI